MKDWLALLLCLLLSCSVWLIMNLSRTSVGTEVVRVLPVSNIEGHSNKALEPVTISARCRTTGFNLLSNRLYPDDVVEVRFAPEDLVNTGGDVFLIDNNTIRKYFSAIFGPNVGIDTPITDNLRVVFPKENMKKVPVVPVSYLSYRPQYYPLSEIVTVPDSVLVYGEPEELESVKYVNTMTISKEKVKNDLHGIVGLETPVGMRLGLNEVRFSVAVGRCVEMELEVPLDVRNVPGGKELLIFPRKVDVSILCAFPVKDNPTSQIKCYVDYSDFEKSIDGVCMIRVGTLPEGVIRCAVEPKTCSCMESSNRNQ